jgi:uncharacterized alpha-E superfamily protein
MMLLSRTAEDLYWLGRNVERAEAVSRLVGEHTNLLVDLPVDVDSNWGALLAVTGSEATFTERYSGIGEAEVVTFLMADVGNPGSVLRSISSARESLRIVRPLVPRSAWECMNRLHLDALDDTALCAQRRHRSPVTERVMASCQQFSGILGGTMSRDHAYRFWQLGCLLERADMTRGARRGRRDADGVVGPSGHRRRTAAPRGRPLARVLRALAAHHMYHRSTGCSVSGAGVVDFLLQDPAFPRSVRHCTAQMEQLLAELPDRPEVGAAIASLDRVTARLSAPSDPAVLHRHVAQLQRSLHRVHTAVAEAYFASAATPAPRHAAAAGT